MSAMVVGRATVLAGGGRAPPSGGTGGQSPDRQPFTPAQEARIREIIREELSRSHRSVMRSR